MIVDWLIAQLHPTAPGFWLLLHLGIAILIMAYGHLAPSAWPLNLWRFQQLLIPYCGLLLGGLSPRLLGLGHIDWQISLSLGAGILFAGLALLVAVRASIDLSSLAGRQESPSPVEETEPSRANQTANWWRTTGMLIVFSGIEQFHWTFLRGSIWELLLNLPIPPQVPAYWAIWIAAILITSELLFRSLNFAQWLILLATLLTTSILFFYTQNFWLCWVLHASTVLLFTPHHGNRLGPDKRSVSMVS